VVALDVVAELIRAVGMLGRTNFNKTSGIEPIFTKGFVPLLPTLMKISDTTIQLNTIKAAGIFIS
jgi:hypothetical protein